MRKDATLDPAETPTTTPTSEKTPARKPVLAPRSITATTKSAINTSRTLRPASSIDRFYRQCKPLAARARWPVLIRLDCILARALCRGQVGKSGSRLTNDLVIGRPRYNLSTMNAAEFLPDVRAVLEERNEPPYRIRQVYKALTGSHVRDWKEATNLPKELQAAL